MVPDFFFLVFAALTRSKITDDRSMGNTGEDNGSHDDLANMLWGRFKGPGCLLPVIFIHPQNIIV